jgi:hypothetical protein
MGESRQSGEIGSPEAARVTAGYLAVVLVFVS